MVIAVFVYRWLLVYRLSPFASYFVHACYHNAFINSICSAFFWFDGNGGKTG